MPVRPETVFDLSVKHRIALSRFSTTVVRRVLALSNRVEKSVVVKIQDADVSSIAYTRLEQLLQEIRAIQASGWRVINTTMTQTVSDLAANEIAFASRLIGASTSVTIDVAGGAPSIFQVVAAANARPFAGRILKEWLADAEESQAKRVREIIRQGFVEGQTTDQMVRAIRGTKAAQYKDGALEVSRRGAETMVRTAITHTANVAHDLVFQANADIVKALRWTSVLDGRTSLVCLSRSGKEYPLNSGPRPPAHPNCLIADSHVATGTQVTSVFKRWYDGNVVVIRTAAGKELTCTPNHPILTDGGWVAAGLLNVGGNVVCDAGIKRVSLIDLDRQDMEARIEDVAEAFFADQKMTTMPVPTAAEDFHGDGIDGEIAVIATNRFLNDGAEASLGKHLGKVALGIGDVGSTKLPGKGGLSPLFLRASAPSNGLMGLLRKALAFFGRGPVHSSLLLGRSVTGRNAMISQNPQDRAARASEVFRNSNNADALVKHGQDNRRVQIDRTQPIVSKAEPGLDHGATDGVRADADLASYLLDGNAGGVTLDQIVSVERRNFAGHVFNLETEGGWYVAENIITHNCRSVMVAIVDDIPGVAPFTPPTYAEWLKKQPAAFQDEVLGKSRGALFRRGGLSVDRFIDKAGHTLTLAELRQRDASAFQKAGLD